MDLRGEARPLSPPVLTALSASGRCWSLPEAAVADFLSQTRQLSLFLSVLICLKFHLIVLLLILLLLVIITTTSSTTIIVVIVVVVSP